MKRHRSHQDPERFAEEVAAKQRNLLWPDTLVNSKSVDKFLFTGCANPSLLQRVGAWIFGLMFFVLGVVSVEIGRQTDTSPYKFVGLLFVLLGVVVFRNGFPKRKSR